MKFQFLKLFLKIFLFMAGYFFLHQNLAAAKNVPTPPPMPSENISVNKKPAPVTKPAAVIKHTDVVTPAPRPPNKKKDSAQPEITTNVPPPPPLPTGSTSANKQPVTDKKRVNIVSPAPRPPSKKKKSSLTPEVTIVPKRYETRAEYRVNNILYMIKIRPKSRTGQTYYLIDQHGDGVFVRSNFKPKNTIPKWVLERSN